MKSAESSAIEDRSPSRPTRSEPARLGARRAIAILLACIVAQFSGQFLTQFAVAFRAAIAGAEAPDVAHWSTLAGELAQALSLVWFLRRDGWALARGTVLRDPGRRATEAGLLGGLAIGAAIAATFLIWVAVAARDTVMEDTHMGQMAATPGAPFAVWLALALVLAPPLEEILYRGILLQGLSASWGRAAAVVTTSVIFVAQHVSEVLPNPIVGLPLFALALGTAAARIRTGSLGPAMALHWGYNGTLALTVWVSTSS